MVGIAIRQECFTGLFENHSCGRNGVGIKARASPMMTGRAIWCDERVPFEELIHDAIVPLGGTHV